MEFQMILDPWSAFVCGVIIGVLILLVVAIVMTTAFIRRRNNLDQLPK